MIWELPNKDSYDEFLQFSKITEQNWLHPDRESYSPLGMPKEQWINLFLAPQLDRTVPKDVIKVFEIARAAMIYSWFFYPLATLGMEQCTRVSEFAVRERCKILQHESDVFFENIQTLFAAGVISPTDEPRWQATRRLRNDRSHLENFMLLDPMMALRDLQITVELINKLFAVKPETMPGITNESQANHSPPQPAP